MRAATIRRLLVFGVCAAGVGALYLAPGMSGTSYQAGLPQAGDRPSGGVSGRPANLEPQPGETGVKRMGDAAAGAGQPAVVYPANADPSPTESDSERRSPRGNTAFDPKQTKDEEPPTAVASITPTEVTSDRLRLTWPRATDNDRVVGYRIWLNGYEVATTAETQVTLRWFNDDAGKHVVQVKAIDAAGNSSASSPTLLLTRPSAEPVATATPTPTPTPSEQPSSQPPTTDPTALPSVTVTPPSPTLPATEPSEDPH